MKRPDKTSCGRFPQRNLLGHFSRLLHRSRYFSAVSTSRIFLSTAVTKRFGVPLTLADVFLRDEQLPFAYAFRETLDSAQLISSLKEVLRRYPILGATADFSPGTTPTLECNVEDTVPMSFGESDLTLDQWLMHKTSGKMQHTGWQSGGGAPTLSPLFDDLVSARWAPVENNDSSSTCIGKKEHIATVRVNYFKGGGTAIAININHMLGDANSCFRICQVWGRAMRGLTHPLGASNNRAQATLTGMISPDMALFLNLSPRLDDDHTGIFPFFNEVSSYLDEFIGIGTADISAEDESRLSEKANHKSEKDHKYARLVFSEELLHAMKSYGMAHCTSHGAFVSTNDMITAMGWLLKRRISKRPEWNLSMVVNLRSRGGIHDFSSIEDSSTGSGVFGNALTSVVATLPPSCNSSSEDISMDQIFNAAVAIRQALTKKMAKVDNLQTLSLSGRSADTSNQGSCFSSTSWMQFPIWDISFTDDDQKPDCLGFYGRPSYPLPVGDTYSSINVPSRDGGCTQKLLAPSREIQSILALHQNISAKFLAWARVRSAQTQ